MSKIRLTEEQLHKVIKESVKRIMLQEGALDTDPVPGVMQRGNEENIRQAIALTQEGLAQLKSLGAVNPQTAPWLQDVTRELKNLSYKATSQKNYNQQSMQVGDYNNA